MLEDSLRQILDTASSWNAVLLIDEADIFLEARTDLNIERNAMVGVFLRLLEYYDGILFLTTNRAENIDSAFFSRISMAIHYDGLKTNDRHTIWQNLLRNSKISTEFAKHLYQYDLNGRQIKNCIRNASALAKGDNRVIQLSDFQRVINKALDFDAILKAKRNKRLGVLKRAWNWLF
jgi:SpoVK/Ycf46/Vps4 family AAA+-type ATPase